MDCYTNNFPGLPCFKKLTADKHVPAELPLVPFVIINLTRLTLGGNQRFFFLANSRLVFAASRLSHAEKNHKKNLWDQGTRKTDT